MPDYVQRPIPLPGYRTLTEGEKQTVDQIKALEAEVGQLWAETGLLSGVDHRSLDLAKERLQDGFMWLVRAVTRPKDVFSDAVVQNAAEGRY